LAIRPPFWLPYARWWSIANLFVQIGCHSAALPGLLATKWTRPRVGALRP